MFLSERPGPQSGSPTHLDLPLVVVTPARPPADIHVIPFFPDGQQESPSAYKIMELNRNVLFLEYRRYNS